MSSLAVGFTIQSAAGCGSLIFTDTTQYGSGGGSGELPSYEDIGKTTIQFFLSNGQEVTISNFIPTAENQAIQIFAGDLNYDDIVPDQEMPNVIYTVYDTGGNVLGTAQMPYLLSCNFVTCFYAQVVKAANNPGCNQDDLNRLNSLWMRYMGIQAAFEQNAGCVTGGIEELAFDCSKFCFNNCPGACQ